MEKEKEKDKEEEREKVLLSENDSENSIFYPYEGGGTFLETVLSSSNGKTAYKK